MKSVNCKCLFVSAYFPPPLIGGSLIYYYYMLSKCKNDDVVVVTSKQKDSDKFDVGVSYKIIRTDYLPYSRIPRFKRNIYYMLLLPLFMLWILKYKPAVLHLGSFGYIIPGWLAAKLTGRYVMVTLHGEDLTINNYQLLNPGNRWLLWLKRRIEVGLLRKINLIQANSSFAKDILINLGVEKDRIVVMTPGVDIDKIICEPDIDPETSISLKNKRVLLTVGRLVPRKGQDMILCAMPELVKIYPDIHYVIAGGATEKELKPYQEIVQNLGLKDNVSIFSNLGNQSIAWLYERCQIFVMPNRTMPNGDTEGYGIVFLEAGAWRKPVIGGRAGGVVDAVDDGVTGLLVDGSDKADITDAIIKLFSDHELANCMGEAGWQKAQKNNWERKSIEYLSILGILLNAKKIQNSRSIRRFAFGENWARFLSVLDEDRIKQAEESLKLMLETENLNGKSFLDIGSGSGLFSLAAKRLGAKVFSFDFDPKLVNCTKELKRRYYNNDLDWTIEKGSVLDIEYLRRLGKFDIVYSWGVLHHTGAMWDALRNVDMNVAPNGKLFLGLYNDQGTTSKIWWVVKKMYNSFPKPLRFIILLPNLIILWSKTAILSIMRSRNPFASFNNYKKGRGMSPYYDLIDWVGGFPFEVSKPGDIFEFYKKLGYQLTKLSVNTGHGCSQYVFQRRNFRKMESK